MQKCSTLDSNKHIFGGQNKIFFQLWGKVWEDWIELFWSIDSLFQNESELIWFTYIWLSNTLEKSKEI